jgi:hypothetical protein
MLPEQRPSLTLIYVGRLIAAMRPPNSLRPVSDVGYDQPIGVPANGMTPAERYVRSRLTA